MKDGRVVVMKIGECVFLIDYDERKAVIEKNYCLFGVYLILCSSEA